MGGGGGDGGYEARQERIEQDKARAREQLNILFGAGGGTAFQPAAVNRDDFYRRGESGPLVNKNQRNYGNEQWAYHEPGMGGENSSTKNVLFFDDGAYNSAVSQAQAEARKKQREAQANQGSRDALYQQVRDSAFTAGKRGLDENFQDAARNTKFELFARGLAGGSEDIDQNARLRRTYDSGLLDLGGKADSAKAQFRNADEQTRLQLLQSIDAGMDAGSALQAATSRMAVAADQAAADAQGTSLGNVFDGAGLIYQQSQAAKGRQAAQDWWNQYGGGGRRGGGGSVTGTSTRLPGE